MLITRESEYAIRMVRALADNEIKPVRKICDDEPVPLKWAYKILKKMEHANIVKSFHGVKGGYRLDKEISEITMLDIFAINENNLRTGRCLHGCAHDAKSKRCLMNKDFEQVENTIKTALNKITIDKLV